MARQKSKLACLREQRGLTQKEVADELGITRQAVSQWEAGRTFPAMEKQIALSQLYGVTLEALYQDGVEREQEVEPETPRGPEDSGMPEPSAGQCRRKSGIFLITGASFLAACLILCVFGILTNSVAVTINLLIFLCFLVISGLLVKALLAIIFTKDKENKDE